MPIDHLVDPSRVRHEQRSRDGLFLDVPYLDLDGAQLWGATAMVLSELASLIDGARVYFARGTPSALRRSATSVPAVPGLTCLST